MFTGSKLKWYREKVVKLKCFIEFNRITHTYKNKHRLVKKTFYTLLVIVLDCCDHQNEKKKLIVIMTTTAKERSAVSPTPFILIPFF